MVLVMRGFGQAWFAWVLTGSAMFAWALVFMVSFILADVLH